MHDPQPRGIAETLVDPDQLHAETIAFLIIFVKHYILKSEYIGFHGEPDCASRSADPFYRGKTHAVFRTHKRKALTVAVRDFIDQQAVDSRRLLRRRCLPLRATVTE